MILEEGLQSCRVDFEYLHKLDYLGGHKAQRSFLSWQAAWVDCYIWYSEEDTGRDHSLPMPLFPVPNATA